MLKKLSPNPEYRPIIGARRAGASVAANMAVSAPPSAFIVTVLRYNGWTLWPEIADASAAAFLMSLLTGIAPFLADWWRMNVLQMRSTQTDGSEP